MKGILELILENKNVKKIVIILSIVSLLLLFNKFIFSFLSLPWAIAYFITSNINWQFDQSIFVDIFNVDDGLDKIRILNLLLMWLYYWLWMKLLDIAINIFYTEKEKKYSFWDLLSVKVIYFLFIFLSLILLLIHNIINTIYGNYIYYLPNYLPFLFFIFIKFYSDSKYWNYFLWFKTNIKNFLYKEFWEEKISKIFNVFYYFKNNLLIFTFFILSFIFFISVREINNQSIIQWVLPTKWYVLINNIDDNLIYLHNKLQLPDAWYSNQFDLIKKINYIGDNYEWRILAWFCLLWENDKYYYISTYYSYIKTKDCYNYNNIQPIRIEKDWSLLIRYLKNAHFKNMDNSAYSKLITSSYWYDTTRIYHIFYDYLTSLYYKKDDTRIEDYFFDYYNHNWITHLDNLYSYYFNSFLSNQDVNYEEVNKSINKREQLIKDFYKWNKEDINSLFIPENDFKKIGMDYITNIKYDYKNFETDIMSALRINSNIDTIGTKENFLILTWTVINKSYVNKLYSIKFLESNYFINSYIDDSNSSTESWTFNNWCIEILTDDKLIYHIKNVNIKYKFLNTVGKYYDYNYNIDLNWSYIKPWSCSIQED